MKLLYLPLNHDEFPGGTNIAFRESFGVDNVRDFDYLQMERQGHGRDYINRALLHLCDEWRPDIVHMQLQETGVIHPDTLVEIRRIIPTAFLTIWMGDCRVSVPTYTAAVSSKCHVVLVSNRGQLSMYEKATERPTRYWQIGVDWNRDFNLDGPNPITWRVPEVVFSGRYYDKLFPDSHERLAVVRACAKNFDFGVVGTGFPSDVPSLGEHPRDVQRWIYAKAKLSIGVGNFNHIEGFYSERQLQAMASGTPHVCWRIPSLEKEFMDGEHCFMFDTPEECVGLCKNLLSPGFESTRAAVGEMGRREVLNNHTWTTRVKEYRAILREFGVAA